jgi:hypothetical protein
LSKWLNARISGAQEVRHEPFATEELARRALDRVLNRHRQMGRVVKVNWIGRELRYVIEDNSGFVAVHWLSDDGGGADPSQ